MSLILEPDGALAAVHNPLPTRACLISELSTKLSYFTVFYKFNDVGGRSCLFLSTRQVHRENTSRVAEICSQYWIQFVAII